MKSRTALSAESLFEKLSDFFHKVPDHRSPFIFRKKLPSKRPPRKEKNATIHCDRIAWGHVNLLGEYYFSDEKLKDSIGIKPPKPLGIKL